MPLVHRGYQSEWHDRHFFIADLPCVDTVSVAPLHGAASLYVAESQVGTRPKTGNKIPIRYKSSAYWSSRMTAKTILLSAGHSNVDPGAVSQGRREADIAVEFRNMVSFYLTQAGIAHDTDGKGTDNLPLPQAARMARLHDLAVEFHCNAAASQAGGVETLSGKDDMPLAAKLCKAVSDGLGINNRGAKPENSGQHSRLAFVQAGGIILELFFITSKTDLKAYYDRKWLAARNVAAVLAREIGA